MCTVTYQGRDARCDVSKGAMRILAYQGAHFTNESHANQLQMSKQVTTIRSKQPLQPTEQICKVEGSSELYGEGFNSDAGHCDQGEWDLD